MSHGAVLADAAALASSQLGLTSEQRFEAVARQHIDFVWRVIRRHGLSAADADDGTQRVFLLFREKAGGVPPGAEKGFLFRVAGYVALELRRGAGRFEEATEANLGTQRSPSERLEAADELDQLMRSLDSEEREVFILFEIEGSTLREIAELLGCPSGTVASRLRRARQRVRVAAAALDLREGGGRGSR